MTTETTAIELSDWEISRLVTYAASNAMTYIQHFGAGNLLDDEIADMNRWKMLADKLSGREPTPVKGTEEKEMI